MSTEENEKVDFNKAIDMALNPAANQTVKSRLFHLRNRLQTFDIDKVTAENPHFNGYTGHAVRHVLHTYLTEVHNIIHSQSKSNKELKEYIEDYNNFLKEDMQLLRKTPLSRLEQDEYSKKAISSGLDAIRFFLQDCNSFYKSILDKHIL